MGRASGEVANLTPVISMIGRCSLLAIRCHVVGCHFAAPSLTRIVRKLGVDIAIALGGAFRVQA